VASICRHARPGWNHYIDYVPYPDPVFFWRFFGGWLPWFLFLLGKVPKMPPTCRCGNLKFHQILMVPRTAIQFATVTMVFIGSTSSIFSFHSDPWSGNFVRSPEMQMDLRDWCGWCGYKLMVFHLWIPLVNSLMLIDWCKDVEGANWNYKRAAKSRFRPVSRRNISMHIYYSYCQKDDHFVSKRNVSPWHICLLRPLIHVRMVKWQNIAAMSGFLMDV